MAEEAKLESERIRDEAKALARNGRRITEEEYVILQEKADLLGLTDKVNEGIKKVLEKRGEELGGCNLTTKEYDSFMKRLMEIEQEQQNG